MGIPSKQRRFFIILFELVLVLLVYKVWVKYTGLDLGSFFVLAFVLFWLVNWLLYKLTLTRSIQSTLLQKVLPRFKFQSDWFGILIATAILIGFFISRTIVKNGFLLFLFMILVIWGAVKLTRQKNLLKHSWGLVILGFLFGLAFGYDYPPSITIFIVIVFVIGHAVLFISSQPGDI